jgi:hypothetical protein
MKFASVTKCCNDVIWPIVEGIDPLIPFAATLNAVTLPKLPICDGRVPYSPLPNKLISTTLA